MSERNRPGGAVACSGLLATVVMIALVRVANGDVISGYSLSVSAETTFGGAYSSLTNPTATSFGQHSGATGSSVNRSVAKVSGGFGTPNAIGRAMVDTFSNSIGTDVGSAGGSASLTYFVSIDQKVPFPISLFN